MRTQVVLLLALLTPAGAAAAQAPAHSPSHSPPRGKTHDSAHVRPQDHAKMHALDPAGSFDLEFDMHGQVTSAVLTVTREKDKSLTGTLDVHGQSITLETVSVDGRVVSLAAGSELTLTLTFSNDSTLLGKWTRSGDSGSLSGTRRKA
jgi:hypothetical protein